MLVWLPEISQTDLNHIMRAIYVLRGTKHHLAETASRVHEALVTRRAEAKKRLGSDDPLLLATVLSENLTEAEYTKRAAKLEGIRLVPADRWLVRGRGGYTDHFQQILKYWRSPEGPFGNFSPEKLESMLNSVISLTGKTH